MDWQQYEIVTKYIYETLGHQSGVKIEGHGSDCKVMGKSGVEHQIDVLAAHSDGIHTYKTAIECKYWKENVSKDIIMKVLAIIQDTNINKGVIVSKTGFTPDAIAYAQHTNIGLVELREMEEKDWEGRPRISDIKSWRRRPEIIKTVIIPSLFNRSAKDSEEVNPTEMILKKHDGTTVGVIDLMTEFKKELHSHPVNKKIEKRITAPMSQLININTNNTIYIDGIILVGVLTETPIDLGFKPVDEIWLIMKSIFEEKSYTISKKGVITEDKK